MPTSATAAFGTILSRGDGGGTEVFTAVAEVTGLEWSGYKLDTPEATHDPITSTFTVTAASTTFILPAGVLVQVGGVMRVASATTLPSGLTAATDYYVKTFSAPNATISATPGGTAVTFADAGTGVHTMTYGTAWRDVVPTLKDGGEISMELSFVPGNATQSGTAGVLLDQKNKTLRNFKITWPDATVLAFPAYVTSFKPSAPVDGKLAASVTLKLTGAPTLA